MTLLRVWLIPWLRVKTQTLNHSTPPTWRFLRIWLRVLMVFASIAIRENFLQDLMMIDT